MNRVIGFAIICMLHVFYLSVKYAWFVLVWGMYWIKIYAIQNILMILYNISELSFKSSYILKVNYLFVDYGKFKCHTEQSIRNIAQKFEKTRSITD